MVQQSGIWTKALLAVSIRVSWHTGGRALCRACVLCVQKQSCREVSSRDTDGLCMLDLVHPGCWLIYLPWRNGVKKPGVWDSFFHIFTCWVETPSVRIQRTHAALITAIPLPSPDMGVLMPIMRILVSYHLFEVDRKLPLALPLTSCVPSQWGLWLGMEVSP